MGWTEYHAQYYKNGRIDRKKEMDSGFSDGYEVVKSTMVGSTYYGAIRYKGEVFACVALTGTRDREWWFAYKDMDETEGPYCYDCPKSILDLLTPTDNKWAKEWRRKCRERIAEKKEFEHLPIGTMIVTPWGNSDGELILTKYYEKGRTAWQNSQGYLSKSKILEHGYKVITNDYIKAKQACYNYLCKYGNCRIKGLPYSTAWLNLATNLKTKYGLNERWFKDKLTLVNETISMYESEVA